MRTQCKYLASCGGIIRSVDIEITSACRCDFQRTVYSFKFIICSSSAQNLNRISAVGYRTQCRCFGFKLRQSIKNAFVLIFRKAAVCCCEIRIFLAILSLRVNCCNRKLSLCYFKFMLYGIRIVVFAAVRCINRICAGIDRFCSVNSRICYFRRCSVGSSFVYRFGNIFSLVAPIIYADAQAFVFKRTFFNHHGCAAGTSVMIDTVYRNGICSGILRLFILSVILNLIFSVFRNCFNCRLLLRTVIGLYKVGNNKTECFSVRNKHNLCFRFGIVSVSFLYCRNRNLFINRTVYRYCCFCAVLSICADRYVFIVSCPCNRSASASAYHFKRKFIGIFDCTRKSDYFNTVLCCLLYTHLDFAVFSGVVITVIRNKSNLIFT